MTTLRDVRGATPAVPFPLASRFSRSLAPLRGTQGPALVLGLIATVISLTGSWIPSLWGDEAASLMSAQRTLPSLMRLLGRVDAVHGTYYAGLHLWIHLAGTSPFALRLPSALAVGAAVAAVVVIGTRLGGVRIGIAAGVICALLPRITYVGEEARSYAFSAAFAAWSTLLLLLLTEPGPTVTARRTRILWFVYAAVLAVGIYVFLYTSLLVLAHAVYLVARRTSWPEFARWLRVTAAAVLLAAPVIVAAVFERAQIAYLATRQQISADSVLVAMWFGYPAFAVAGWLLLLSGLGAAVTAARRASVDSRAATAVAVAAWVAIPSVALIGTSPVLAGFTARYLAFAAPAVALMMAAGVAAITRRRTVLFTLTVAVLVALAIPAWVTQRGPYSKNSSDWQEIGQRVQAVAAPGDAVVFDESTRPSRRPRLALRTYPQYFAGLADPGLGSPYWLNRTWYDRTISVPEAAARGRFAGVQRVWVIEYATVTATDSYGIEELQDLGYVQRGDPIRTYRSRILEFVRTAP